MNYYLKANKLIFVSCFFLITKICFAQFENSDFNGERYWYYKTRFNNDFIKVGCTPGSAGRGESLPFQQRNLDTRGSVKFEIGDETSTMGVYLGVLATEYHLLSLSGQNTDKICYELFCALNALNRLDYETEGDAFNHTNSLNGFMIKDDLYKQFVADNYAHFNYFNKSTNSNGNAIDAIGNLVTPNNVSQSCGSGNNIDNSNPIPVNLNGNTVANPPILADKGFCEGNAAAYIVHSDWEDVVDDGNFCPERAAHVVINQDQFITLLMGLSLVSKYAGGAVYKIANVPQSFLPYENEQGIQQEAINITNRIWNYFSATCNWDLFNPATGIHQTIVVGHPTYDYGGIVELSYPISEAVCHINDIYGNHGAGTDGDFQFAPLGFLVDPPHSCDKSKFFVSGANNIAWYGLHNTDGGGNIDVGSFIANLNATCDCGWDDVLDVHTACNNLGNEACSGLANWFGLNSGDCNDFSAAICDVATAPFNLLEVVRNHSYNQDMQIAVNSWYFYHANLLYEALNGSPSTSGSSAIKTSTNIAVEHLLNFTSCRGPYNFGPGDRATFEWTSDSRIEHPNRRESTTDGVNQNNKFYGNYNGLDYMLYYNLYRIVNPTSSYVNGAFFDLSDRIVSGNFACPGGSGPSCTIGAFETIKFEDNCAVTPSNDVDFRAGKYIDIGAHGPSGTTNIHFSATNANVHIYVKPYSCDGDGNYQRSTENNSGGDYGDMGSNMPTHYIPQNNTTNVVSIASAVTNYSQNTTAVSSPVSKQKPSLTSEKFSLYPNPNNGLFNITVKLNKNETYNYEITDVLGKTIVKETGLKSDEESIERTSQFSLDARGVFYMRLNTSGGYSSVKKIVIQ